MPLQRGSGIALWRQIQKTLEQDISSEAFAPGEKLPTEQELAERFGVNRHTVRRALGVLEARGLVSIEQGRGTFVREHVVDYALARRVRFSENLVRQSRSPGGRLLDSSVVQAQGAVAESLELLPGSPVIRLDISGQADGKPLMVATSWFPQARFPGPRGGLRRDRVHHRGPGPFRGGGLRAQGDPHHGPHAQRA